MTKKPPMKIRLRKGEEPVEVTAESRFLVGLSSGDDLAPGETRAILVRFQVAGFLSALLVDRDTAANFELADFRIGKNSCFCTVDPIPLSAFVADLEGYPDTAEIVLTDKRFRDVLDLGFIQIAQDVTLSVTNTGDEPRPFKAAGFLQMVSVGLVAAQAA